MMMHGNTHSKYIFHVAIIQRPLFYLKHDVSESGFRLRLQVKVTQLGLHEDWDRFLCPKHHLSNKRQNNETVQNSDSYTIYKHIDSINLLGSYRRRNVFPVKYGQTHRVELSFK
jgi:hypothetical protein